MDPHALPRILQEWPSSGARNRAEADRLVRLAATHGYSIDPYIPRDQVRRSAVRLMHREAAIPGLFSRMYGQDLRRNALKLGPSRMVPIALDKHPTQMWIDTVRRSNLHGKNTYLEIKCRIDIENIPVILQGETKCSCLYCGTRPSGSETTCRSCGAQLPDC